MAIESHSTLGRAVTAGLEALPPAEALARVEASRPGDFASRCREWHAEQDAMEAAQEEASRKIDELEGRPEVPRILMEPLQALDGTERLPPESPLYFVDRLWTASALDRIIDKGGFVSAVSAAEEDRVVITSQRRPLSDAVMARVLNMRKAAADYEEASKRFMDLCGAIEDVPTERYGHLFQQGLGLIREPVNQVSDVAEKVRIVKRLDLINTTRPDDPDRAIMAMLDDVIRMAEGSA